MFLQELNSGSGLAHPVREAHECVDILFYQLLLYGKVWISAFLVSIRGTQVDLILDDSIPLLDSYVISNGSWLL